MSLDTPLTHIRARRDTRRSAARSAAPGTARSAAPGTARSIAPGTARSAAPGAAPGTAATAALVAGRRLPTAVVVLALVAGLGLLAGGWLALRDSSLVRVTQVRVTGVSSSAEPRIDAALDAAARQMTTLHVREDVLRRAVAGFPSVAGLRVRTDLPHGLTIAVLERRPVAALVAGERRMAVTGDGRLLRDVQDTMGLPTIVQGVLPAGERVDGRRTLDALALAAAAPRELRRRADRITYGDEGLEVRLLVGPPLIFGTADEARAKWIAATRVLADRSSAGATYLDLREVGRVAAGGLGPVVPEDSPVAPAPAHTVPAPAPAPTASATPAP